MRPKYSPIAPISILRQLFKKKSLDNYLLLLAHDVLEHSHEYEKLVHDMREWDDETFIIMDNGTIERGSPVSVGDLVEAANLVEADCIAAPDVVGDFLATQKLCMEQGSALAAHFPLMLIPQGATSTEIYDCIDWMDARFPILNGDTRYWGIPRWFTNTLGTRSTCINYIANYTGMCKIHLLGMSGSLKDDFECCRMPYVMGIDSANPLVLGYNHVLISGKAEHHMPRGDYWDECTEVTPLMEYNVEYVHNVLSLE